jgi:hypothetical protein
MSTDRSGDENYSETDYHQILLDGREQLAVAIREVPTLRSVSIDELFTVEDTYITTDPALAKALHVDESQLVQFTAGINTELHTRWGDVLKGTIGELRTIAVPQKYQGVNIGSDILRAWEMLLKQHGIQESAAIAVENPEFFRAHGYKSRIHHDTRLGDIVIFVKDL